MRIALATLLVLSAGLPLACHTPAQPTSPPPAPRAASTPQPATTVPYSVPLPSQPAVAQTSTRAQPTADDKKWSVANPPSSNANGGWGWHDVPLDTDEGTWLSLDLSPDGQTIVFDLLGDLYTMPAAGSPDGSQVKCIAEGLQWDMQPRFSPDGAEIAFVSDRTGANDKGGDNIWVMKADGSNPRQITKESFRLFTQPTWSPDGQYIVARKHFTSRRSLGAGEMWMFHASGKTDGLQLTAKTSEQKDTGEPAMSLWHGAPALYYSYDATGGSSFEYDKDSNPGIYAINRLDLTTQKSETVVAGPGGACRPLPSPDGSKLAFVRRVRYQTSLFIIDLKSGETRQVYDALERDNQETWAVHGVYPNMAWAKDGKSIVLYAKGKIRRLDLATGQASIIPFRVTNPRKIAEAIRFPVQVAPKEAVGGQFDVKMMQNVAVSPKGDKVLFQALGHIYTADFKDNQVSQPKPVPMPVNEFQFYPAWAPDGQSIVYVAWNDEKLAQVRTTNLATGETDIVTAEPGHYTDPIFSPSGDQIAYIKTGGGYITSPLWGRDGGVYITSTPGREKWKSNLPHTNGQRLSTRGSAPQFSPDGLRLFLTVRDGGKDSDGVSLISVPVNGVTPDDAERTHYKSDWAAEIKLSPDGKFVAYAERFNVYAVPFLDTGKPIDLSPRTSTLPLVRLTSEAGSSIHWSGDSTTLHWSLGPDLYTQNVAEALKAAALNRAESDPKPEPAKPAVAHITLHADYDAPCINGKPSSFALTNVKILPMTDAAAAGPWSPAQRGMAVIEHGTILVEGRRIAAIGPSDSITLPSGIHVIDGRGATVTPGLVDVHAHGSQGEAGFIPQKNWIQHANLAFGVTTIHDPSNDTENVFEAAELQRSGAILAPRIYSTGTILYGAAGAYKAEVDSLDDALFHIRRMKAVGAASVKSYNQPRRDQRQMILEAARREGINVVPEGGALYQHNMTMVVDGHTTVEHTLPTEVLYKDALTLWGASRTGISPTLLVAYGGMGGENYWYAKTNAWEDQHLNRFVPRYVLDPRSRRRTDAPDGDWNHIKEAAAAKAILDAKQADINTRRDLPPAFSASSRGGFGPALGAHGQIAGIGPHWELWSFVQGGMTPHEALRAVTLDSAAQVGLDGDVGSLAPGKLADFLLFAADPSKNIQNTASIQLVIQNGRVYNAANLEQTFPAATPAPTYFFEALQRGSGTPMALEAIMRQAADNGGCCKGCGRE